MAFEAFTDDLLKLKDYVSKNTWDSTRVRVLRDLQALAEAPSQHKSFESMFQLFLEGSDAASESSALKHHLEECKDESLSPLYQLAWMYDRFVGDGKGVVPQDQLGLLEKLGNKDKEQSSSPSVAESSEEPSSSVSGEGTNHEGHASESHSQTSTTPEDNSSKDQGDQGQNQNNGNGDDVTQNTQVPSANTQNGEASPSQHVPSNSDATSESVDSGSENGDIIANASGLLDECLKDFVSLSTDLDKNLLSDPKIAAASKNREKLRTLLNESPEQQRAQLQQRLNTEIDRFATENASGLLQICLNDVTDLPSPLCPITRMANALRFFETVGQDLDAQRDVVEILVSLASEAKNCSLPSPDNTRTAATKLENLRACREKTLRPPHASEFVQQQLDHELGSHFEKGFAHIESHNESLKNLATSIIFGTSSMQESEETLTQFFKSVCEESLMEREWNKAVDQLVSNVNEIKDLDDNSPASTTMTAADSGVTQVFSQNIEALVACRKNNIERYPDLAPMIQKLEEKLETQLTPIIERKNLDADFKGALKSSTTGTSSIVERLHEALPKLHVQSPTIPPRQEDLPSSTTSAQGPSSTSPGPGENPPTKTDADPSKTNKPADQGKTPQSGGNETNSARDQAAIGNGSDPNESNSLFGLSGTNRLILITSMIGVSIAICAGALVATIFVCGRTGTNKTTKKDRAKSKKGHKSSLECADTKNTVIIVADESCSRKSRTVGESKRKSKRKSEKRHSTVSMLSTAETDNEGERLPERGLHGVAKLPPQPKKSVRGSLLYSCCDGKNILPSVILNSEQFS